MMIDTQKTKVIYRFWEGDVIAIFPELAVDFEPYHCESYQHIGQHGACNPSLIIWKSKLATPEQYQNLHNELNNIGYNLQIIKRLRYKTLEIRRAQIIGGK